MHDLEVGNEAMADYLLFWMNKNQIFDYVNIMKLDEPCDDIRMALAKSAFAHGMISNKVDLATGNNSQSSDQHVAS